MVRILTAGEFEKEARAVMAPPFASSFGAVRWRDLGASKPKYDWLVKGMIAAREVAFLAGPSGSGKSFLTTDLSISIARGIPWFGRHVKKGAVVYIAAESSQGVVSLRLPAYAKHHGIGYDADLPFLTMTRTPNFYRDEEGVARLIAEILAFEVECGVKIELVVVDTFAAATRGADEIKGVDMGRIRERLQSIVDKVNTTVLCVHHMNKGGESLRGHSSLKGDYDSVLLVSELENRRDANNRPIRRVTADKIKEGAKGASHDFVLRGVSLGLDEHGEEIVSCVAEKPEKTTDEPQNETKAFVFKSDNARLLYGCLVDALRQSGDQAPRELNLPFGHRVVHADHWREVARHKLPRSSDPTEAANHTTKVAKAVETAIAKFMNLRLIGHRDDLVWLTGRAVAGFTVFESANTNPEPGPQDEPPQTKVDPNDLPF